MFKLQELIRRDIVSLSESLVYLASQNQLIDKFGSLLLFQDKLALNITTEQGKTLKDAQGDVFRGLG